MKIVLDTDLHDGVGSAQSSCASGSQVSIMSDGGTAHSPSHPTVPGCERDTLVRLIAEQTARIAELESALSRASNNGAAAYQENQVMDDLVAVTRLLRRQEDDAEWLRKVAATLLGDSRRGALISLLPGPLASFFRKTQLKRRGLFDVGTYRAANPDVASARVDALRHYIIHGIGEGRARR